MSENTNKQNKESTNQLFLKNFKGKSFQILGLDVPKIRQVEEVYLQDVITEEYYKEYLFTLEDNSVAIIKCEEKFEKTCVDEYICGVSSLLDFMEKERDKYHVKLRVIVIYTADVSKEEVPDFYDIGALVLRTENIFMLDMNFEKIMRKLTEKVEQKEMLTEEEQMEFVVLPLSCKEKERQEFAFENVVKLAEKIEDEEVRNFVLSGLKFFTA